MTELKSRFLCLSPASCHQHFLRLRMTGSPPYASPEQRRCSRQGQQTEGGKSGKVDERAGQEVDRRVDEPTVPTGRGAGRSAGPYLWDPRSQDGGRVLGQCHVVHHVVRHPGEHVALRPVSAQLLKQVCDQVVPLLALLDQGSQLGLGEWE